MCAFEAAFRCTDPGERPIRRDANPASGDLLGRHPVAAPATSDPADAPAPPGGGLAGLLARARDARAELEDQPLPIANRDMLLITKLLGG